VHADCAAATDDAAALLSSLGHTVEEVDVNRQVGIDPHVFAADFFHMVCIEVSAMIDEGARLMGKQATARDFETATWLCNLIGRQHSSLGTARARARLQAMGRGMSRFFENHDVLLSPTLALPPVAHGALQPRGFEAAVQTLVAQTNFGAMLRLRAVVEKTLNQVFAFMPFTPLANVAGLPSMNVPLYWNAEGLPIGSMLTGRFGDEATLFRLAAQLEQARPWAHRKPPLHSDP
jgi:amidase